MRTTGRALCTHAHYRTRSHAHYRTHMHAHYQTHACALKPCSKWGRSAGRAALGARLPWPVPAWVSPHKE
ncbi:hypothetical protein XELAEV_18002709mg [Xenopus laevis]|uniref:Uncharacterized protein n=1 Tax=Xenopus laevis TaxID=8355 RepID=A0A974GYK5_XENLA|nr:hypothetical protein XELAEV_18002709mg [Xenopus laevis]